MTTDGQTCFNCIWLSTGLNDPHGYGYCYAEMDHVDVDGHCAYWQHSLRKNPLPEAPQMAGKGDN